MAGSAKSLKIGRCQRADLGQVDHLGGSTSPRRRPARTADVRALPGRLGE
jgi:hypothetical protein